MKRRFVRNGKVIYIEMTDEEFKAHRSEYNKAWRAKNKAKCRQYVIDRTVSSHSRWMLRRTEV